MHSYVIHPFIHPLIHACIPHSYVHQQAGPEAALTQRHLVDEAEVTVHHLGLDEHRRRVYRYPMETARLQRVPKQSRVVGCRTL